MNHPIKSKAIEQISQAAAEFYRRGWVLGTGGNFSALLSSDPIRILITRSGAHKGFLKPDDFLEIDGEGQVLGSGGPPSAETGLHLATYSRVPTARAFFHTHSVWSTLLSRLNVSKGELIISGYEMLKGLAGVKTHEHSERLPVLANSQDIGSLALQLGPLFEVNPGLHGFLLSGHGLSTWGSSLAEAWRHVEILEFLLESEGRRLTLEQSALRHELPF